MLYSILNIYIYIYIYLTMPCMQICWLCEASKGVADLSKCFTDLSVSASWRPTWLRTNPWAIEPAYAQLHGFCLSMVYPDLLHVFNLGVGRDAAGSIIKKVLQSQDVFHAPTIDLRFQEATASLRSFARANGYGLKMKKLSRKKVAWSGSKYPELQSSGSDTHVVFIWLEDLLKPFSNTSPQMADFCTLLWSCNRLLRVLYAGGWFLDVEEKNTVNVLGEIFMQTYMRLAWDAVNSHTLYFRVKPKFHLLTHIVEHPRYVNASYYSTWMDEDYLKKVAKTLGLTNVKTAQTRFLQRWLLTIPENLRRSN